MSRYGYGEWGMLLVSIFLGMYGSFIDDVSVIGGGFTLILIVLIIHNHNDLYNSLSHKEGEE
jgi:hypothetical protein